MNEQPIAYDCRTEEDAPFVLPNTGVYGHFLREDIDHAYSVDTNIWSSVFDLFELPDTGEPWWSPKAKGNLGFQYLEAVQESMAALGLAVEGSRKVIAVSVVLDEGWEAYASLSRAEKLESAVHFIYPEDARPEVIDPSWPLLGYDVADTFLLSGLMNCPFTSAEKMELSRFAKELNRFHLFRTPGPASVFRHLSNERVPEHAPFLVYGVYELPPAIVTVAAATGRGAE